MKTKEINEIITAIYEIIDKSVDKEQAKININMVLIDALINEEDIILPDKEPDYE